MTTSDMIVITRMNRLYALLCAAADWVVFMCDECSRIRPACLIARVTGCRLWLYGPALRGRIALRRTGEPHRRRPGDLVDARLEVAKQFGATHCLNPTRDDVPAAIADITSGHGIDVAMEASTVPAGFDLASQVLRRGAPGSS